MYYYYLRISITFWMLNRRKIIYMRWIVEVRISPLNRFSSFPKDLKLATYLLSLQMNVEQFIKLLLSSMLLSGGTEFAQLEKEQPLRV